MKSSSKIVEQLEKILLKNKPLRNDKKISKKEGGFHDSNIKNQMKFMLKCKDNKCVSLAYNFKCILPLSIVPRRNVKNIHKK